jgi:pilus assembly protein Flp/PilA
MGRSTHCPDANVTVPSPQEDTTNDQGGIVSTVWVKIWNRMAEEKGASMVEYALLVVLIAIVAILAIRLAGNQVSSAFSEIGSGLQ